MFSNAIDHSIVVRRASVAGLGDAAKFRTADPEIRFSVRFDTLSARPTERQADAARHLHLPGGQTLRFVVNDDKGAATPDGAFRVFAGLRSDPFYLAWLVALTQPVPQPAAARQRAEHRHRVRHAPRARTRARARCSA